MIEQKDNCNYRDGSRSNENHVRDWMKAIGEVPEELEDDPLATSSFEPTSQQVNTEKEQAISLCRSSLDMLAGVAIPDMFVYCFPPILLAAWLLLTQTVVKVRDFSKIALGIPRGFGKTTITKLFVLWVILFTKKRFILIIASTSPHAENIIADIAKMLSHPNIVHLFGDWRLGRELDRLDLKKFGFMGRNIILMGIGAEGAIRGVNLNNDRPDVMIFEDVQTAEDAKSDTVSKAIEDWMFGTAMKAKSPSGCMYIFNGNMYPGPNSILKKLKINKQWTKFISGAILADGTSIWPEHRSIEELLEEFDGDIEAGKAEIFLAEVLNDTEAGINTSVDLSKIRFWPYQPDELPQGRCIIIDPASGKTRAASTRKIDPTTIAVMEVFDGKPCYTHIEEGSYSPGNTIKRSLILCLTKGIRCIGIEATSYQSTLCWWFNEEIERLGIVGIQAVPLQTGGMSKNSRIHTMLKSLTAGEILVHDSVRNAVTHQIVNWNPLKANNDDGILDILCYGPKMLELYSDLMICHEDFHIEAEVAGAGVDESAASYAF